MSSTVASPALEDYGEVENKKPAKRGFAKIDVVDVILSGDQEGHHKSPPSSLELISEAALNKGIYEPSYRLEPKKKFDADKILPIIKENLEKELIEISYNEKECENACKRISYYIRRAVKHLSYDRYRIICQVRIIEKQSQGMETRAGFLWDSNFDGFSCYSMETQSLAAQAVVFAIYKD